MTLSCPAWTLGSGTEVERNHEGATGLVSGVEAGPAGGAALVNLAYGYDALGNLTHYGYDANGRMTSGAGYASAIRTSLRDDTGLAGSVVGG